ncbi:MAG: hypothetical protein AB7R55_01420 [Gemmatimonadales bacterium]
MDRSNRERERSGVVAAAVVGTVATLASWLLSRVDRAAFVPYFGGIEPVVATAIVATIGVAAVRTLRRGGWFVLAGPPNRAGLRAAFLLATLFAAGAIGFDLLARFPRSINEPLPMAAAFYPLMGLVAETVFHLAPLALILGIGWRIWPDRREGLVLVAVVVAAAIEPAFQVRAGLAAGRLSGTDLFVVPHVLGFNLAQLWLFRRYDLLSMLAMRMSYYLYWHLAWGTLRLELLF